MTTIVTIKWNDAWSDVRAKMNANFLALNNWKNELDIAQEYTKTQNFNATTLVDWANISWDLESNQVSKVTLTWNRTLDNPTNMVDWATYILRVIQDAAWSRTLSYGTAFKFPWWTNPVLTTTANAIDFLTFISDWNSMFGVSQSGFS